MCQLQGKFRLVIYVAAKWNKIVCCYYGLVAVKLNYFVINFTVIALFVEMTLFVAEIGRLSYGII